MKKAPFLLLLLSLWFALPCAAVNTPAYSIAIPPAAGHNISPEALQKFAGLSIRQIEKLTGRHLKFKEKVAIKFYQWKIKKGLVSAGEGSSDKGKTAMIFGIIGLAVLFIPYVAIAAIPLSILALVFGYDARKKNPDDRKARTAIILGWITVGLIVLSVIIVAAVLSSLTF